MEKVFPTAKIIIFCRIELAMEAAMVELGEMIGKLQMRG